ncbi:hypothetical protein C8Q77DRAFT_1156564 [Trametes polyzona]|nr:hypothetical protein C8Q77DRAFT_1156564 [Trametes polyzona]
MASSYSPHPSTYTSVYLDQYGMRTINPDFLTATPPSHHHTILQGRVDAMSPHVTSTHPHQAAMQQRGDWVTLDDYFSMPEPSQPGGSIGFANTQFPAAHGLHPQPVMEGFSHGSSSFGTQTPPQPSRSPSSGHVAQGPSAHALGHNPYAFAQGVQSGAYTHNHSSLHRSQSSSSMTFPSGPAPRSAHERPRGITPSRSIHSGFSSGRVQAPTEDRRCEWEGCEMILPDAEPKTIRRHLKDCHFADKAPSAKTMVVCRWGGNCRREPMQWENLAKHIAECHTKTMTRVCVYCGDSFARSDTLKRHSESGNCTKGPPRLA